MKTAYMLYSILFLGFSVIRVDENLDGRDVKWCAHDCPQDGRGGTDGGFWVSARTPADAVWALRKLREG